MTEGRRLLIMDTETTGIDAERQVVEIAWCRFDLQLGTILDVQSFLCKHERPMAPEAIAVTGFPCDHFGEVAGFAESVVGWHGLWEDYAMSCDYIMAHNAEFDRAIVPPVEGERWICSMKHWPWSTDAKAAGKSLSALALHHGVGMARAHRAFDDVLTLATILERLHKSGVDLVAAAAAAWEYANMARTVVVANVSIHEKDKAKSAGFRWNPTLRLWWHHLTEEEAAALAFPWHKASEYVTKTVLS